MIDRRVRDESVRVRGGLRYTRWADVAIDEGPGAVRACKDLGYRAFAERIPNTPHVRIFTCHKTGGG